MTASQDCPICEFAATSKPATTIYDDELWFAGVMENLEVPGWFFLTLRRHGLGPAAMTPAEASSFGPVLVKLTSAIEEALDSERVYVLAWGEQSQHLHVLLSSRGKEIPPAHRHTKFWDHRADYINPAAAEAAAALVRQALDGQRVAQKVA